jgi:hypothetical protein
VSALVIKAWKASEQPIEDKGKHIAITGRVGGLVAWNITKYKYNPTTTNPVATTPME